MNLRDLKVEKGTTLTVDRWNGLVEALIRMEKGPGVEAPLVLRNGAIGLGQDYQIYWAITTGVIEARSGTQWGFGNASFLTVDVDGVESTMPGFSAFVVWNWIGGSSISSGIRIPVCWSYEKWVLLGGECSS
jgi:hypothetical protein